MKDPWSSRQNAPVKCFTQENGDMVREWLHTSQLSIVEHKVTVISAFSRRRQEADRQMQLSFDTRIQGSSISLEQQTD